MAIRTVESACNPATRADVAAVTMAEGLANICLITRYDECTATRVDCHGDDADKHTVTVASSMSILVGRVESSIPRKRKASATQHDSVRISLAH